MQFARRFWIAAICTLGLLATSAVQAQPAKLLPNDTEMVVTINLQQVLKSEALKGNQEIVDLAKTTIKDQLENKGIDKYLKKAEFDLFKDLHSVTFAIPGGRPPEEGFIVLEGKFDADKIEAAATDASNDKGGGLKVTRIGTVKAFEISPEGEKVIYIGVLNKKTMIAASTKADFADAVARLNGTKQSILKAEVKALLETVNNKQSISIIATGSILAKLGENAPMAGNNDQAKMAVAALKQLDGLSLAITVQKNIDFQVGINTKDNDTANQFALVGNVAIGTIKQKVAEQAKKDEKIAPVLEVLNSIRATAQGNNLVIRGQVSFETLQMILQNLPRN